MRPVLRGDPYMTPVLDPSSWTLYPCPHSSRPVRPREDLQGPVTILVADGSK